MRLWQTIRASAIERHVHKYAYAAVVLSGDYEEAGDSGVHRVHHGDVVLHEGFEAHLNRIPLSGATILNLLLPWGLTCQAGAGYIDDPDQIARVAESSRVEAATLLLAQIKTRAPECHDWPDELAADLTEDLSLSLSSWAEQKSLTPWQLSRGFAQVFGISPRAFRTRARTRQAWKAIRATRAPLAEIAAECGFADQAHMTRCVRNVTGNSPMVWRDAANRFKTQ